MRTLITGVNGFVGAHLAAQLLDRGDVVVGIGRGDPSATIGVLQTRGLTYRTCPLDDAARLQRELDSGEIEAVVHLAATRVAPSPADVYRANVVGTSLVLEAAVATKRPIRVVVVGSSAMYGNAPDRAPQREDAVVRPVTPYGVSKACADLMAEQVFLATGLPVLRARPFNVIGPGQRGDYFISVCARQIAQIERGAQPPVLKLGNLDAFRDFVDVRDVVGALIAMLDRGTPGEAYNVCSGRGIAIRGVVDGLVHAIGRDVAIESTPPRVSATDVPYQVGSYARLEAHTGWRPQHALEQTLHDVLDDWRRELDA